jgi:magnesium chelatase family protein
LYKLFFSLCIVMSTKIFSATTVGVQAYTVEVEVDLAFGMLQFYIVGLPDTAIKESRQRITAALKNSGFRLPERKITVNLAPAALKKEGTLFDVPIALGILHAAQLLVVSPSFLEETIILGELSLDGSIRPIKGALPIAFDAPRFGKKRLIVPYDNTHEAALIHDIEVIGVKHLVELVAFLRKEQLISPTPAQKYQEHKEYEALCFGSIKGQKQAKRALQIAAAGRHNVLFIGPPGAGKTLLAKHLPTIMPPMTFQEVLETSKIYSVTGKLQQQGLVTQRPFRNPHHTISQAGLVGGGSFPQPGEISLAHHGILFLDELTEFKRATLEVLRQPLESNTVSLARAQHSVTLPASFLLVAALNPCPCGFFGDQQRSCSCLPQQIKAYFQRISGPLLDRIDIQIHVPAVAYETIKTKRQELTSQELYEPVKRAVAKQRQRTKKMLFNALLTPELIEQWCPLTSGAEEIMKKAFDRLKLSMRSYHKILKVARTIADLDEHNVIEVAHIQEALMYRSLDRYVEQL